MDSPEKFTNSKEVIAFLADAFPNCFSIEGDAKPLKIGIFQDLASRLQDDERVSKTLLRSSLRHYTNSWRYLHCIKEGAFRVDLDGNPDAPIEQDHAEHAKQQLDESKAKAAEKRKARSKQAPRSKDKRHSLPGTSAGAADSKKAAGVKSGTKSKTGRPNKTPPAKLTESDLQTGTRVTVKLGKAPMPAVITEIAKDGVHVQLDSGMVVKVTPETLRLASSKRS
ncbi:RNA chaperone ProQ [Alteromonas aestuariivivens]|uniref:RNA chaperone ProQ n=1 Tax=Alteromonas aestuariivivens TaxID=1938339 RepID=A0A3D8M8N3_9ALTE|nr:RNA chaperone ProQ [Alteromonas aestuariivivens]RDV25976.1 RNA chaperone ProQ [Alteromonas aestuariivivens]